MSIVNAAAAAEATRNKSDHLAAARRSKAEAFIKEVVAPAVQKQIARGRWKAHVIVPEDDLENDNTEDMEEFIAYLDAVTEVLRRQYGYLAYRGWRRGEGTYIDVSWVDADEAGNEHTAVAEVLKRRRAVEKL